MKGTPYTNETLHHTILITSKEKIIIVTLRPWRNNRKMLKFMYLFKKTLALHNYKGHLIKRSKTPVSRRQMNVKYANTYVGFNDQTKAAVDTITHVFTVYRSVPQMDRNPQKHREDTKTQEWLKPWKHQCCSVALVTLLNLEWSRRDHFINRKLAS